MLLANVIEVTIDTWSALLHIVTCVFIEQTLTGSCLHSSYIINKTNGNRNKR